MCIITVVHYGTCKCYTTKVAVCESHINHTREQVDDMPCPKIDTRHIQLKCKCTTYRETHSHPGDQTQKCDGKPSLEWLFGGHTTGDWTFMETQWTGITNPKLAVNGVLQELPIIFACMQEGRWIQGNHHVCDIGEDYGGSWRHLDDYGQVIANSESSQRSGFPKELVFFKTMDKSAKEMKDKENTNEKRKRRHNRGRISKKNNSSKNEGNIDSEGHMGSARHSLNSTSKDSERLKSSLEYFNDLMEDWGSGALNIDSSDWSARQDARMAGAMAAFNLKPREGEQKMTNRTDSVFVKLEVGDDPVKIEAAPVKSISTKKLRKSRSSSGLFIKPEPTDDVFSFDDYPRKMSLDSLESHINKNSSIFLTSKADSSVFPFKVKAPPMSSSMFNFGENGNGFPDPPDSPNFAFSAAAPGAPGLRFTTPPQNDYIPTGFDSLINNNAEVLQRPLSKRRAVVQRESHTEPKRKKTAQSLLYTPMGEAFGNATSGMMDKSQVLTAIKGMGGLEKGDLKELFRGPRDHGSGDMDYGSY